jgi:hypothetical protein
VSYPLQNKLRNAVALLNGKVHIGKVEQQHLHFTPVIGIDNPRTNIDKVLGGETTSGSNTTIYKSVN